MKKNSFILSDRPLLLFILFLFVAYLPVFLPFFHLKNDLVSQNLPTRFVISESVYSGYFPWWNPYIHFGIPQYGDMNNGFWNPFIWIISKTVGYNIWTITLEEMLYIFLGGWGIYKITREFLSKETSILTGLSYMACGYTLGHLQHFCWITGTAFFPYVILFFIRAHKQPRIKNFICGAFALFFFLASTHPGLIIGGLYFFLFLALFIFIHRNNHGLGLYSPKFGVINFLFAALSLVLSSVIVASNVDVLQHISRGQKLPPAQMLMNPTSFQSYISLFVPLAVNKSAFFATDISMRNVYIGLAGLAGLVLFITYQRKKIILTVALPLLFFILLSSGGTFKILFSKIFPFVGFVRMNGEFTYFAVLILIFAGAAGFDRIIQSKYDNERSNRLLKIAQLLFGAVVISSLIAVLVSKQSLVFSRLTDQGGDPRKSIKYLIDNFSFSYLLLADGLIQLATVIAIRKNILRKPAVGGLLALNLVIHCWLIVPYTGVGMKSKKEFNNTVSVFEKGIHAPEQTSIRNTRYLDSSLLPDLWMISSYSKKIGYRVEEFYPVQLRSSKAFFADPVLFDFIINQSYLFLGTDTTTLSSTRFDSSVIHVLSFGPGYIKAAVSNNGFNYITLLQNDYPFWKVKINHESRPHFTGYKTFITSALPRGDSLVEFIFDPYPIRWALWISLSVAGIGAVVLLNKKWRNRTLFPV